MKKEDGILILENEEDKDLLFDMCDSYIFWFNNEDEKMHEDYCIKEELIYQQVGGCYTILHNITTILSAFANREEFFIELWPKILECFKLADLVKVVY